MSTGKTSDIKIGAILYLFMFSYLLTHTMARSFLGNPTFLVGSPIGAVLFFLIANRILNVPFSFFLSSFFYSFFIIQERLWYGTNGNITFLKYGCVVFTVILIVFYFGRKRIQGLERNVFIPRMFWIGGIVLVALAVFNQAMKLKARQETPGYFSDPLAGTARLYSASGSTDMLVSKPVVYEAKEYELRGKPSPDESFLEFGVVRRENAQEDVSYVFLADIERKDGSSKNLFKKALRLKRDDKQKWQKINVNPHLFRKGDRLHLSSVVVSILTGQMRDDVHNEMAWVEPSFVRPKPESGPAIVLMVLDGFRIDLLIGDGPDTNAMPFVKEMMDKGLLFSNMFSPSPWRPAAHMSLLTGLYPSHHGVLASLGEQQEPLSESIPTIVQSLQKSGYQTSGYVDFRGPHPNLGFARGFDSYIQLEDGSRRQDLLFSESLKWLEKNYGNKSFLYLQTGELINSLARNYPFLEIKEGQKKEILVDGYLKAARRVDNRIRQFVKGLQTAGQFKNTIIILTSSHGKELGERSVFSHGHTLYDKSIEVPLIVYAPDRFSPQRVEGSQFELIDVSPTILDLAGVVDDETKFSGQSLMPLFSGKVSSGQNRLVISEGTVFGVKRVALRYNDGGYKKFIVALEKPYEFEVFLPPTYRIDKNPNLRKGWYVPIHTTRGNELYDLSVDPKETNPIEVSDSLRERLVEVIREKLDLKRRNE